MQIQNNLPSMNASRNKSISENKLKKSLEKLSSGYRIVRAGDDAAGLAVSESMRSKINGLNQAMRNINDGIGLTNVGDGALEEVHAMLQRLKTLAMEGANSTYTQDARDNLDMERVQLLEEIDRIGKNASYAGENLFSSRGVIMTPPEADAQNGFVLQIGDSGGETMEVQRWYLGSEELNLQQTDFTSVQASHASLEPIETAIQAVSEMRAHFGASYNHLERTHNSLSVTSENMTAAESSIRDTEMTQEFVDYTKTNIVMQYSNAMIVQANALPDMIIKILEN